jgi:hypothetical protein
MKVVKLLGHINVEGVFVRHRQALSSSRFVTLPMWQGGVSIASHPRTRGWTAVSPPATSTGMDFITIFKIVSNLKNLLLLMFWVALRLALILVAQARHDVSWARPAS